MMSGTRTNDDAKTYAQWLDRRRRREDRQRCPVCGHRSLTPIRNSLNWLMALVLGAAPAYIVLDVVEDGRLDGSLWRAVTAHHHASVR